MTRSGRAARPVSPGAALRGLERLRLTFGPGPEAAKRSRLAVLRRARLASAGQVRRLHEMLCLLHAYPDGPALLREVRAMLARFAARTDVIRHAEALAGSGIAGTPIDYRFYYPTARWLARRWPRSLEVDWSAFENRSRLAELLGILTLPAEAPALDALDLEAEAWIARLARSNETDGAFLARRFAELPMEDRAREVLWDGIDTPLRLVPGSGTPQRTTERSAVALLWAARAERRPRGAARNSGAGARADRGVHFVRGVDHARPDLARALAERPRAILMLSPREGQELVDLARSAMVTRQRDLDAFAYADPRDVRLVDFGDGLQFACLGVEPGRRLLLEAVYGYLTLMNGVPVGYVLTSALFGSSEVAYNVFETYRGVEAARIYGRALAMTARLFGSDSFVIDPYQIGHENEEAIGSGAFWFYWKLGFRPRRRAQLALARREQALLARRPGRRTSAALLRRLAEAPVHLQLGAPRADVLGVLPLEGAGLAVSRFLARNYGSDRARGERECAETAAERLGLRNLSGWTRDERESWRRWAPLVRVLPGVTGWSAGERRALIEVIRAKGGRREDEFVRRFDAHRKLRWALARLMRAHASNARPTG